jgi:hypothetical protein
MIKSKYKQQLVIESVTTFAVEFKLIPSAKTLVKDPHHLSKRPTFEEAECQSQALNILLSRSELATDPFQPSCRAFPESDEFRKETGKLKMKLIVSTTIIGLGTRLHSAETTCTILYTSVLLGQKGTGWSRAPDQCARRRRRMQASASCSPCTACSYQWGSIARSPAS